MMKFIDCEILGHQAIHFLNYDRPMIVLFRDCNLDFTWQDFHKGKPTLFIYWGNTSPTWWMRYGIRVCL